jgi:hypothetical protein
MQPPPLIAATSIPGMRISNYRNSARRAIRLIGLGAAVGEVVNRIALRSLPNVATESRNTVTGWPAVVGDMLARDLNMIVIVCREGDEHLFQPVGSRPDVLVTFVVLLQGNGHLNNHSLVPSALVSSSLAPDLEQARASCDLFVTTSDPDYVSELIDNLAS